MDYFHPVLREELRLEMFETFHAILSPLYVVIVWRLTYIEFKNMILKINFFIVLWQQHKFQDLAEEKM